jgi:O-antigen/teichoic acid export membrane protein
MLVTCPIYLGMAATAEPFVATLLGQKWLETAPIMAILAFTMPVMTLQILFHPILNAIGLPHISIRTPMAGAVIMPITFFIAAPFGTAGLAAGWLVALPLLLAFTVYNAKPHVGFTVGELFKAVMPSLFAAIIMAIAVGLVDHYGIMRIWPDIWAAVRLCLLAAIGAAVYAGLSWMIARETCIEVFNALRRKKTAAASSPETIASP